MATVTLVCLNWVYLAVKMTVYSDAPLIRELLAVTMGATVSEDVCIVICEREEQSLSHHPAKMQQQEQEEQQQGKTTTSTSMATARRMASALIELRLTDAESSGER